MKTVTKIEELFLPPTRMTRELLEEIDLIVDNLGYRSRSEFIREAIEDKLESLKGSEIIQVRDISKEQAEKEIIQYIKGKDRIYASELAEELRLDLNLTFEIINGLFNAGKLEEVK